MASSTRFNLSLAAASAWRVALILVILPTAYGFWSLFIQPVWMSNSTFELGIGEYILPAFAGLIIINAAGAAEQMMEGLFDGGEDENPDTIELDFRTYLLVNLVIALLIVYLNVVVLFGAILGSVVASIANAPVAAFVLSVGYAGLDGRMASALGHSPTLLIIEVLLYVLHGVGIAQKVSKEALLIVVPGLNIRSRNPRTIV